MSDKKLEELLKTAFRIGFAFSREGFNGECPYDYLMPSKETLNRQYSDLLDTCYDSNAFQEMEDYICGSLIEFENWHNAKR